MSIKDATQFAANNYIDWHDIRGVEPPEKELLLVCGPAGYAGRPFLTLAYHDSTYRPPINGQRRWLNVQNDCLTDFGWEPTHWARRIALPGFPL